MNKYQNVFQEIAAIVDGIESLKKTAFQQYAFLVDAVLRNRITDRQEIEQIMDGLSDFGDDEAFLDLYRKLCRHVYSDYPAIVGEHVALFRALFMRSDTAEENINT